MPRSPSTRMRAGLHTYTGYSIGCGAVWAAIIAAGELRLDDRTRKALRLGCAAWWSGWTSASIARVAYPPAAKLTPAGERRLRAASVALVALGLGNAIRVLAGGGRRAGATG